MHPSEIDSSSQQIHLAYRSENVKAPQHLHARNDGSKPRYSDSIVPVKEDTTDTSRIAPSYNRNSLPNTRQSISAVIGRPLQRVISLSNVFAESVQHQQPRALGQDPHFVPTHLGALTVEQQRGRPRSFSDTSIYARSDTAGYPTDMQLPYKGVSHVKYQLDDDETSVGYIKEDQYDLQKTLENEKTESERMKTKAGHVGIQDAEVAIIGLTEFGKQERLTVEKQQDDPDKTLVETADPVITEIADLYENEWNSAVAGHENLYKQTARSLGRLLDGDMMQAAYGVKKDTSKISVVQSAAQKAIIAEAAAAKGAMSLLLANQNQLLLRLNELNDKIIKRDEKIIADIRHIHETSLTNQEKNWNEYVAKANDLEARIELVKNDKTLVNGWGVYFTELMHKHRANTPPGSDRAKSARTTRSTTRS